MGSAPSFREAPFADETWEIWGAGLDGDTIIRWDRWFQMHDMYQMMTGYGHIPHSESQRHMKWLRAQSAGKPIYMIEHNPEYPDSVTYPRDEMVAYFGEYNWRCSITLMAAMAIKEIVEAKDFERGRDTIGFYGVDMAMETEYAHQRAAVRFFDGWAQGAGINVEVAKGSSLRGGKMQYGYDDALDAASRERIDEIAAKQLKAASEKRAAELIEHEMMGAYTMVMAAREGRL